jgi:MFS family permease
MWRPLRLQAFRHLWLAQTLSLLGDGFSYVALAWLVLLVTNSSLALGSVLAVQAICRASLTLVGGAMADRISARLQMLISSLIRAGLMTALGLLVLTHVVQMWEVYLLAAAFGIVDAFFQPAMNSILPSLLTEEHLEGANSLLSSGSRVSGVFGPALGGLVVAAQGPAIAFFIDASAFLVCVVALATLRVSKPPESQAGDSKAGVDSPSPETGRGLFANIKAGLAYASGDPRIRALLVIDGVISFCYAGPFSVGLASLARYRFSQGAVALGTMDAALAVGALAGALMAGLIGRPLRLGLLIAGLAGWLGIGMGALAVASNLLEAVLITLAMGIAIGFEGVFGISWVQRNIASEWLGRIVSVDMMIGYSVGPLSLLITGTLAQVELALVFGLVGVTLLITALTIVSSRAVRSMR